MLSPIDLEYRIQSAEYYFATLMDQVVDETMQLEPVDEAFISRVDNLFYTIEAIRFLFDRGIYTDDATCLAVYQDMMDQIGINVTLPNVYEDTTLVIPGVVFPPSFQGPQGAQGPAGPQGVQGPRGFQGFQGNQGPQGNQGFQGVQGPQGFQGVQGPQGTQGPQGLNGTSVVLKGAVQSVANLPSTGNTVGDLYVVLDNGDGYVWDGTQWDDAGQIQGPQGFQGNQGPQGSQGPQGASGGTLSGTTNRVAKFTTSTSVGDSNITDNGTLVSVSTNIQAPAFVKSGGTAFEFLKADGTIDSNLYVTFGRTLTINGVAQDLSANRTWTIDTGVMTFNTRTGAVTLTSGDVTSALGFTPYNSSNPSGYINRTQLSANAPLFYDSGTGNFSIFAASSITNGFLTSTDWSTFNNKQNALGYTPVPNTRTLTINGTTFDLTANRSWTVGNITGSGTVNYVPVFTTGTNLGNSEIVMATVSGVGLAVGISDTPAASPVPSRFYVDGSAYINGTIRAASQIIATSSMTASSFAIPGGSTFQFLKADGSVDSNTYATASGSTNTVAKFVSGSGLGNSIITDNGTSVGINKPSPSSAYRLDIGGGLNFQNIYNRQTGTSYTLVLTDASKIVEMNNASANTVTVPFSTSVDFPIGTEIAIMQYGIGQTFINDSPGVAIRSKNNNRKIADRYTGATLVKIAQDEWYLVGNLTT